MLKRIIALIFAIIFIGSINTAQAISFSQKTKLVNLRITPEYKTLSQDTKQMTIIAEADIEQGWHLYWDNPGDIGGPTTLTFFESPNYLETSSVHSSPSKSVYEDIITSYVYTKKIYFRSTFELKDLDTITRLPFRAVLSYTACRESCLPEEIHLNFALPISTKAEENPTYLNIVMQAENTFPLRLNAKAKLNESHLEIELQDKIFEDCGEAEFVSRHPKRNALSELPETTVATHNQIKVDFSDQELPPDFKGIILCPGHAYYIEPNTVENLSANINQEPQKISVASSASSSNVPSENQGLWYYILTAFIAGLILNLMPCVLPILSLKALYLIQNKQHANIFSALSYLSGVVCSFLVLAGILFYLREIGNELGWGFQLQSPLFNVILLLLFFIIFLNLIDKLPLPDTFANTLSKIAGKQSFLTGFFAVVIACPCTGPFMGAALGYAITKPALIYFSIFLALSIGYALPYTMIELFPRFFLKYIPKPGYWMITLKRILALPILLTCFWLGWIIANQIAPAQDKAEIAWEDYAPQKVETAIKNNQPVFINFTAKWCLVCLLNDKSTLSTQTFKDLAKQKNIKLFKADWTNKDETIGEALKSYNRNSIPLYVYYPQGSNPPKILPQILTTDIITEELK